MAQALKDAYNHQYIEGLAQACEQASHDFSAKSFVARVFDDDWDARELKARSQHIRHCLHTTLNRPFPEAVAVLKEVAPGFSGYEALFFPDYVEAYGQDDWECSMDAMEWLTRFSSAEFSVRPFILRDPEKMMAQMRRWSLHDNEHVRRLASEGCRPRLPWGQALKPFKRDPALIMPILDQLREDESDYVRRSVANNLNDIAKDNPQITLEWAKQYKGQHPHTDWIIKHGCRTLLKQAQPDVMALFNYHPADDVMVTGFQLDSAAIKIGEKLEFRFQLQVNDGMLGRLRIEYAVDYVKANGQSRRKVFKLSEGEFEQPEKSFRRTQSFHQMTTRVHYPGTHRIAVLVNGVEKACLSFELD